MSDSIAEPMMPALRSDVLVERVGTDRGFSYDISSRDLRCTRRLSERAWHALSLLKTPHTFTDWVAGVRAQDQGVDEDRLLALLRHFRDTPIFEAPLDLMALGALAEDVVEPAPAPPRMVDPPAVEARQALSARELGARKPRARADLTFSAGDAGLTTVTVGETGRAFDIYTFEADLLRRMDGTRTVSEMQSTPAGGRSMTLEHFAQFVREMRGYGFLADADSADSRVDAVELGAGEPDSTLDGMSKDERRLFDAGLALAKRRDDRHAADYFRAILEINGENESAKAMLELLEARAAVSAFSTTGSMALPKTAPSAADEPAGARADSVEAEPRGESPAAQDGSEAQDVPGATEPDAWMAEAEPAPRRAPTVRYGVWAALIVLVAGAVPFVAETTVTETHQATAAAPAPTEVRAAQGVWNPAVKVGASVDVGTVLGTIRGAAAQKAEDDANAALSKAKQDAALAKEASSVKKRFAALRTQKKAKDALKKAGKRVVYYRRWVKKKPALQPKLDAAQKGYAEARTALDEASAHVKALGRLKSASAQRRVKRALKAAEADLVAARAAPGSDVKAALAGQVLRLAPAGPTRADSALAVLQKPSASTKRLTMRIPAQTASLLPPSQPVWVDTGATRTPGHVAGMRPDGDMMDIDVDADMALPQGTHDVTIRLGPLPYYKAWMRP